MDPRLGMQAGGTGEQQNPGAADNQANRCLSPWHVFHGNSGWAGHTRLSWCAPVPAVHTMSCTQTWLCLQKGTKPANSIWSRSKWRYTYIKAEQGSRCLLAWIPSWLVPFPSTLHQPAGWHTAITHTNTGFTPAQTSRSQSHSINQTSVSPKHSLTPGRHQLLHRRTQTGLPHTYPNNFTGLGYPRREAQEVFSIVSSKLRFN